MSVKQKLQVRDLRVRKAPIQFSSRVRRYMGRVADVEKRDITKEEALLELLDFALNHKGIE